jgi:seryl-tRNA synthetase (EC 6.1.1.11)
MPLPGCSKKIQLAHTLNGSALALPRIVAALLENNQTDAGIRIPKVLVPYTGFNLLIKVKIILFATKKRYTKW